MFTVVVCACFRLLIADYSNGLLGFDVLDVEFYVRDWFGLAKVW